MHQSYQVLNQTILDTNANINEIHRRDPNESFTSHTLRTIHRLEHLISKFGYYK